MSASTADGRIDRRERIAWALVFSIPPGIGIAIATAKVSLGSLTDPIVVTAFVVTTVVMFAIVYGATSVNQGDSESTATSTGEAGDSVQPGSDGQESEQVPAADGE